MPEDSYDRVIKKLDNISADWEKIYEGVPWGDRPARPKNGYNSGGYEWCVANWGTKWPPCETQINMQTKNAFISFQTAWSAPGPIVYKLAEKFPDLTFDLKFWECGAGFKGQLKLRGQEVLENWESKYSGDRGG